MARDGHSPGPARPPREAVIVVTVYETLADVLSRVRSQANSVVRLEIPDGSPLFLTAGEFRALREAASQRRVSITIGTDDPLRTQLAGVFGLPASGSHDEWRPASAPPLPVTPRSGPRPAPSWDGSLPPLPGAKPESRPRPSTAGRWPDTPLTKTRGFSPETAAAALDSVRAGQHVEGERSNLPPLPENSVTRATATAPSSGEPEPRPRSRKPVDPNEQWRQPPVPNRALPELDPTEPRRNASPESNNERPRWPSGNGETEASPAAAPPPTEPRQHPRRRPQTPRPRRNLTALAAPLIGRFQGTGPPMAAAGAAAVVGALLLVFGVSLLVFARAEVTVTMAAQPVNAALTCVIVNPNGDAATNPDNALVLPGESLSFTIEHTASVETTGNRTEPGPPARGQVQFANPTGVPVTLEAGTTLTSYDGREYRIVDEVTIPAGDATTAGIGDAEVEAVTVGADGNIPAGQLGGRLDNGLYFSNRNGAVDGGEDQIIGVVAPTDVRSVRDAALAEIEGQARAGDFPDRPSDLTLVPTSVQIANIQYETSDQAGEDAESITTTATATVTALGYRPDDVEAAAEQELARLLSMEAPEGFELAPASVRITSTDVAAETAESLTLAITGAGAVSARFGDADQDALSRLLSGKGGGDAEALLRDLPNVARYEVDYRPVWLPNRMPFSAERIDIVVVADDPSVPTSAESTPGALGEPPEPDE